MAEPGKRPERDVNYIGVSAEEFLQYASEDVRATGDETRLPSDVREGYSRFVQALQQQKAKPRYYVFVFSRFIIIKIEF